MLYLLPNLLIDECKASDWLPGLCFDIVPKLDGLICENEKRARVFLKLFAYPEGRSFRDIPLLVLNEHTPHEEIRSELIPQIKKGTWGLVSDCGLPLLADPGSALVAAARKENIQVVALPGPSSVFLSLMLSGLPTQQFAFHGYLPREASPLAARLKELEERSKREGSTHLFIEAPYRNVKLFEVLLKELHSKTHLCVAAGLTGPDEWVKAQPIQAWKQSSQPPIHKIPTIFLFNSA